MQRVWTVLWLAGVALPAHAADSALDDGQRHGRALFVQSCGICHLKPNLTSERYGPALSRATVDGREEGVRALIRGGSERMPGFQYELSAAQLDAIIAYLKTVPEPKAPPSPNAARGPAQAD